MRCASTSGSWTLLGNRQIEGLVDLPLITDPEILDTLDVYSEAVLGDSPLGRQRHDADQIVDAITQPRDFFGRSRSFVMMRASMRFTRRASAQTSASPHVWGFQRLAVEL
jgi:hypothetical protein